MRSISVERKSGRPSLRGESSTGRMRESPGLAAKTDQVFIFRIAECGLRNHQPEILIFYLFIGNSVPFVGTKSAFVYCSIIPFCHLSCYSCLSSAFVGFDGTDVVHSPLSMTNSTDRSGFPTILLTKAGTSIRLFRLEETRERMSPQHRCQ